MTIKSNPPYLARLPENLVPMGTGVRHLVTGAAQSVVQFSATTSVTHVLLAGDPVGVFRFSLGGETPTTTSGALCSGGVFVRNLLSVSAYNAMQVVQVTNTGTFYAMPMAAQ